MALPPIIVRPGPEEDRPRRGLLAAIGLAGLLAGLLLVRCSMEAGSPEPPGGDAEGTAGAPAAANSGTRDALSLAATDGGAGSVGDAGAAPDTGADSGRAPGTGPADAGAGRDGGAHPPVAEGVPPAARVARLLRLAYLRCDGVERPGTATGCERDRDLERAAWAVVRGLPSCPTAPPGLGESDVHLHFTGGEPEVLVREDAPPGASRLDGALVVGCLREPLAGLRTTLRTTNLVISVRFELTPPQ